MANTKISALPAGAPAQSTDLLPIARDGANASLQVSDVLANAAPLASPSFTGQVTGAINAMGNVSGSITIDLSKGNVITMTLTGNVTSSAFANAVASAGQDVTFIITQNGTGGFTFVWPSAIVPTGIAPQPSLVPNSVSVFEAIIDGSGNANFAANGPVTVFRQKATNITTSTSGSPTFTPPAAGNYVAYALIRCTTAGTTATMNIKIATNAGAVNSQGLATNAACTAVGLQGGVSFPFYDDASSAAHTATWFNTLVNAIGMAVYAVEFWIEYVGD